MRTVTQFRGRLGGSLCFEKTHSISLKLATRQMPYCESPNTVKKFFRQFPAIRQHVVVEELPIRSSHLSVDSKPEY